MRARRDTIGGKVTQRKELRTARGVYSLERLHHKDEFADHWVARGADGAPVLIHLAPYTTMAAPARRAEFSRASNAAMAMAPHPNLCTALDGGEDEGGVLYMIEVLHAELRLSTLLARAMSDGAFPWWVATSLVMDAAKAIEALLQATPRKFSRYAVVELDDFEVNTRAQLKLADAFAFLRQTSTPKQSLYRAPETWFRDRVDERSHVFVLGTWLWEFCAGKHLFLGGNADAVMARTKAGVVGDLRAHDDSLPDELIAVIKKALSPSPLDRFERPGEFADALKGILGDRSADVTHYMQTVCADLTHVAGGMRSPQVEVAEVTATPQAVSLPIVSADILPPSDASEAVGTSEIEAATAVAAPRPAAKSVPSIPPDSAADPRTQVLLLADVALQTSASAQAASVPPTADPEASLDDEPVAGTVVLKLNPSSEALIAAHVKTSPKKDTLPPESDLTDPLAADDSKGTKDVPLKLEVEPESERTKFAPLETAAAAAPVPARPSPSLAPAAFRGKPPAPPAPGREVVAPPKPKFSKDLILGGIAAALLVGILVIVFTGRGSDPEVKADPHTGNDTQTKTADPEPTTPPVVAPPPVTPPPVTPAPPVAAPPPIVKRSTRTERETPDEVEKPKKSAKEPAGETGMITVVSTPACKLAVVDQTALGPCPISRKKVPVGMHVLKIVGPSGAVKTSAITVDANRVTVVRESF